MTEQHFNVPVPNTTALASMESDSNSTQVFLGLAGSVGYLSLLAFVVLRMAAT